MDDACKELGVSPGASRTEIEQAFRERARQIHPDAGGSTAAFRRAKEARDMLLHTASNNTASSSQSRARAQQAARTARSPFDRYTGASASAYQEWQWFTADEPTDAERKANEQDFWQATKQAAREQEPRRRSERARAEQRFWARKAAGMSVPGSFKADLKVASGTAAALALIAATMGSSRDTNNNQK